MKAVRAATTIVAACIGNACSAEAPVQRHVYAIEWSVQPVAASSSVISARKGAAILTTRLLPPRLFKSTHPIYSAQGENLVDVGEAFVLAKSDMFMACTPMMLKKTKSTNRAGSRQVCVLDADGDKGFDHYFANTVGQLQGILIQGTKYPLQTSAALLPLQAEVKFLEVPIETDIGLPTYQIRYGGSNEFYSCLGSGMVGSEIGCIETDFHWIEPDEKFVIAGAEFAVVAQGNDRVSVRLEKGLPSQLLVVSPPKCLLCTRP